ncbi:MAG: alpha/beta hydrolase [archaeon]|nr:alpha/beta hydrolase [archaeon]
MSLIDIPEPPTPEVALAENAPAISVVLDDEDEDSDRLPAECSGAACSASPSSLRGLVMCEDPTDLFHLNTDMVKISVSRRGLQDIITHIRDALAALPRSEALTHFQEVFQRLVDVMDSAFEVCTADYDERVAELLKGLRDTRALSPSQGVLFWVFLNTMGHYGHTLPQLVEEELIATIHILYSNSGGGFFSKSAQAVQSEPQLSALFQRDYVILDSRPLWTGYRKVAPKVSVKELLARAMRIFSLTDCIEKGEFDPYINRNLKPVPSTLSIHQIGTRELPSELRHSHDQLVYRLVAVGPIENIKASRESVTKQMTIATASFVKSFEYDSKVSQVLMTGASFMYYGLMPGQADRKFRESHTSIQSPAGAANITSIWNMLDDPGFIKYSAGVMFEKLPAKGMRKIRIPVPKPVFSSTSAPVRQRTADPEDDIPEEDVAPAATSAEASESDSITARFLSSTKLPCWNKSTARADRVMILHFHGGGFIAMSSYSHQDYSRQWANLTGFPILSVDYRLAPEFPYPTGVNDCWASYEWALAHSREVLGRKPLKIIITGDSAGGGLTASVTLRAIRDGSRVPDGVLMSYPALNLYRNAMLPSRVLAFKDAILPFAFLDLVIKAYIPEHLILSAKEDPLLSPAHAPAEWLERFPPAFLGAGDADPLYHDAIQFAHRLHKARRPVGLSVYRGFPHGYLSFSALIRQAKKIIVETAHQLTALGRGTFAKEMMFAPEQASEEDSPAAAAAAAAPSVETSPADDFAILFCRNLNYAEPSLSDFRQFPDRVPQPLLFSGVLQVRSSLIWHSRYLEIRSCFLIAWKSDSPDAGFSNCWILRNATVSRDLDNSKYINLNLFVPNPKAHDLTADTLSIWSDDQQLVTRCLDAFSRATSE